MLGKAWSVLTNITIETQRLSLMHNKMIHISGLVDPASLPAWLQRGIEHDILRWVQPAEVISVLERDGLSNGAELWWCYSVPWAQVRVVGTASAADASEAWMALHRRLLRARARSGVRLRLVNVGMAPSLAAIRQGVQQALELDLVSGDLTKHAAEAGSASVTEAVDAMLAVVAESSTRAADNLVDEISAMLGRLYAWISPETWDLVEALNAASWGGDVLSFGRDDLPMPSLQALTNLTLLINAGQQAPEREEALLRQARAQHAALTAEHAASLAAAQALHSDETGVLRAELAQLETECQASKALQVQDNQHHQAELASLRGELEASLSKARAEQKAVMERAQADVKAELEKTQAELEAVQAQLKEAQGEGEQVLLQLHKVQEDLEHLFLQGKEREAVREKEQAAVRVAAEQHAKEMCDAKAQLQKSQYESKAVLEKTKADYQAALEASQGQLKEAQREGELLLMKLYEAQEELERLFLRSMDLEHKAQDVARRYERLQRRHPDDVEIDTLEVADTDSSGAVPFVTWRLRGLAMQGHFWPDVVLRTSLELGGSVGLKLEAPAGAPLAYSMDGPLVPKNLAARQPEQLQRFRMVGATAWRALVAACAAVDEALVNVPLIQRLPTDFDPVFWRQALGTTAQLLRGLPPMFRHDGVRLKTEQVNPDYEHLWLTFSGASYGDTDLGLFEMRLGAAEVMPGLFSHRPKLEFPTRADGSLAFEGWYAESQDDLGPKLELRADLERKAFDVGVWSKLPKVTQSLLLSVIAALPVTLKQLAAEGARITRPWDDWHELIGGLIDTMRLRLSPAKPAPVPGGPASLPPSSAMASPAPISAPMAKPVKKPKSAPPAKTSRNRARKPTRDADSRR